MFLLSIAYTEVFDEPTEVSEHLHSVSYRSACSFWLQPRTVWARSGLGNAKP